MSSGSIANGCNMFRLEGNGACRVHISSYISDLSCTVAMAGLVLHSHSARSKLPFFHKSTSYC